MLARSIIHLNSFERDMFAAGVLEQPRAAAEQHGDEVDKEFVNEAECDELLRGVSFLCEEDKNPAAFCS